jgi:hypothetical protein
MPFKILYKEIISHYEPITKAILEKLECIADPKDKIKYLKSEEIKYLIDVAMNPSLMNASAILTTANPHKAGLDRWIELKIKEIEINYESVSVKKNKTINSYVWKSNPEIELPELYRLMFFHKLIGPETTYDQFKAVFTGQSLEPIKWISSNRLLAYFLDCAFYGQNWQSIAENGNLFLNLKGNKISANDLSVAKSSYNVYGKPKGYEVIDSLLREIKSGNKFLK